MSKADIHLASFTFDIGIAALGEEAGINKRGLTNPVNPHGFMNVPANTCLAIGLFDKLPNRLTPDMNTAGHNVQFGVYRRGVRK